MKRRANAKGSKLTHFIGAFSFAWWAALATPAYAVHTSLVIDNHPAGGPGATGEQIIVPSLGEPGSPLVEGPEAPGVPHVHGPWIGTISPGHADPHTLHPDFLLGHGIGQPIVHTDPGPGPGPAPNPPPVSTPSHEHDDHVDATSRDVALREVVIPLGADGRAQGEGAELAAFFGQAGLFDALFVQAPPPVPTRPAGVATTTGRDNAAAPSPEAEARYQELIDLNVQFATRIAQTKAGLAEFNARIDALTEMIEKAPGAGAADAIPMLEEDRAKLIKARDEWRDYMTGLSANTGREIDRAYKRNGADGLGPTNGDELVNEMSARGDFTRTRTLADGTVVTTSTLAADQETVDLTRQSTQQRVATALNATAPEASIFTDMTDPEAWGTLVVDVLKTEVDYLTDPTLFYKRYWAYTKGVGLAVKDGVVDLATLGVALVETNLQLQQAALNTLFGTDLQVVGTDRIEYLVNVASAASQMDSNAFYTTVDRFLSGVERKFEKMAGSGEKGIEEALQGTGYVFTTIIGGEEIAFRAVAAGVKGVKIVRLGRADEVLEAGEEIAQAGNAAGDAARAGDAPVVATPSAGGSSPGPAVATAPSAPTTVRTAANGGALLDGPSGRALRQPDGQTLEFGETLGKGGTSETFAVKGNPNLVIKETKPGDNFLAGALFDRAGQKMLNDIDPNLAVKQIGEPIVIDGKQYTVFERADSFQETRFRQAQADGVEIPTRTDRNGNVVPDKTKIPTEMTPGQLAAYQEGIGKLNAQGFVFLDNKIDNWSLVKVGEPDKYQMKIIDQGSLVKLTDADAAQRMQRKIDAAQHGELVDNLVTKGNQDAGMQIIREELAAEFDPLIDKAAMERYGVPIESIGEVAFNPVHGYQNPSVRALHDVDIGALTDAEFADFLRNQGWSDAQIEEIMDLPPPLREQSFRTASNDAPGSGAGGAEGGMTDQDFRDYLRRQDPEYWTEERLDARMAEPPPPNPWADEMPDFGDETPTKLGGAGPGARDAVNEMDAGHAAPPAAPPRFSFAPEVLSGEAFAVTP